MIFCSFTDDTSIIDENDISLTTTKQTLGKGKRARIPNKRYSDIALAKAENQSKKSMENGSKENDVSDSPSRSPPQRSNVVTPSPAKKLKVAVDLTNPNYMKPFKFGWKRELVYRSTSDNSMKRNGDIYYYTPSGKKVRSMREVSENLKDKDLTLDDFTFFKEPLGCDDPEKEIIRYAKLKSVVGITPKKPITPKTPKTPKPSSPKLAPSASNTPVADTPTPAPRAKASPRVSAGSFKVS